MYNTFKFCDFSMNCISDHQHILYLFRGGILINAVHLIIKICIVYYMSDMTDIHSARKLQNCSDYVAEQIIILAI